MGAPASSPPALSRWAAHRIAIAIVSIPLAIVAFSKIQATDIAGTGLEGPGPEGSEILMGIAVLATLAGFVIYVLVSTAVVAILARSVRAVVITHLSLCAALALTLAGYAGLLPVGPGAPHRAPPPPIAR
jgi:hypothetical protein